MILGQAKTDFEKHLKKDKILFDILSALLELDESKLNVFWFPPLLKLHSFQIGEENTQNTAGGEMVFGNAQKNTFFSDVFP